MQIQVNHNLFAIAVCKNYSVYGTGCDTECTINCQDNNCHIQNGTCFACRPGWTEDSCETSTNVKLLAYIHLVFLITCSPFSVSPFGCPSVHLPFIF